MPRRREQRDQLWLTPKAGQSAHGLVAEVALCLPTFRKYSYAAPADLAARLRPGVLVRVRYGRAQRLVEGFCTAVSAAPFDHTLSPLDEVLDEQTLLTPRLVQLGEWVADYYAHPPGLVLQSLTPQLVRAQGWRRARFVRRTGNATADISGMTPRRRAVLEALEAGELPVAELLARSGAKPALVRTLVKAGLIEQEWRRVRSAAAAAASDAPIEFAECVEDGFALTSDQQGAIAAIQAAGRDANAFHVLTLFGVPGSGKTEVYVRAIRALVAAGKQAIIVVPEIALATQFAERLARRFPRAALLHGALPPARRRATLEAIYAGQAQVVVGTRTAVFAPCTSLGLIVVDEEQESSLKNLAGPYYHARDVAIKRAQLERVPVVLGSATPSMETWHNSHTLTHYQLLRLPTRVPGATLPRARLVPIGGEAAATLLSPVLLTALRQRLEAGEQAILLHNRRGYAPLLRCERCRLTLRCGRCGLHLVFHKVDNTARCHHCGRREAVPEQCPDSTCGGLLVRIGPGIQRLEEELQRLLPGRRLLRLDSDTMRKPQDYRAALESFERGAADILIGTQMVAKGLDFPRVGLVGVLDADALLTQADFRAAERTFQLLMQTIGRAGRRAGASEALVQCLDAEQPVLRAAARMDYEAFAAYELEIRRELNDPPYARLTRLVFADPSAAKARRAAEGLYEALRALAGRVHAGIDIGRPGACLIPQLRGMWRFEVLIRAPKAGLAQQVLALARSEKKLSAKVERLRIDVDCIDLS